MVKSKISDLITEGLSTLRHRSTLQLGSCFSLPHWHFHVQPPTPWTIRIAYCNTHNLLTTTKNTRAKLVANIARHVILKHHRQAASKHTFTMADAEEIPPNATFVHCTPYEPAQGQDHMLTMDTGFTYVRDNKF